MKALFLFIFLLRGALASAYDNAPLPPASAWDLIIAKHKAGTEISFSKVAGTYVGRCYESSQHEVALGSALGFYLLDSYDGPLLPPKVKKVIYGLAPGYAADSLDKLDKEYLDDSLLPSEGSYTPTDETPVQFSIQQPVMSLEVHVVRNGPYLYLLASDQGEIFNACYFFIKK